MVDMDLLLALASHARHRPDHLALAYADERVTYAELAARVGRLVSAFQRHGCQPGDRVGVACYQGTLPGELYLAAQAADLVPAMLPVTLGEQLPELAADINVRHLFVGADAQGFEGLRSLPSSVRVWTAEEDQATVGDFLTAGEAESTTWVHRRPPE